MDINKLCFAKKKLIISKKKLTFFDAKGQSDLLQLKHLNPVLEKFSISDYIKN